MLIYLSLAIGSGILGVIFTAIMLFVCTYFNIDISQHMWLLGVPAMLAVVLNICFIELYLKFKKK